MGGIVSHSWMHLITGSVLAISSTEIMVGEGAVLCQPFAVLFGVFQTKAFRKTAAWYMERKRIPLRIKSTGQCRVVSSPNAVGICNHNIIIAAYRLLVSVSIL